MQPRMILKRHQRRLRGAGTTRSWTYARRRTLQTRRAVATEPERQLSARTAPAGDRGPHSDTSSGCSPRGFSRCVQSAARRPPRDGAAGQRAIGPARRVRAFDPQRRQAAAGLSGNARPRLTIRRGRNALAHTRADIRGKIATLPRHDIHRRRPIRLRASPTRRTTAATSARCLAAIDRIAGRGGRFLVFGRAADRDRFETLAAFDLPPSLLAICDEVRESDFRADVSSTQLRRRGEKARCPPDADNVKGSLHAPLSESLYDRLAWLCRVPGPAEKSHPRPPCSFSILQPNRATACN